MTIPARPPPPHPLPSRREPVFPDQRTGPAASLRGRLLAASRPALRRRGLGLFAALAVLAHLLLVGAIVALPRVFDPFGHPPPAPPAEPATVALVMQNTPSVGGSRPSKPKPAASARSATRPSPAPPTPTPLTASSAPDSLSVSAAAAGAPAASASRSSAQQSQSALASAEINLDSDDAPGTGIVSGDNVVPARPDDRHKNEPPIYPVAAQERGEAGSVVLVVTVAPDGHASAVEVASSSGHSILDDEAKRAVSRWHFRPAIRDGKPVESFFDEEIDFDGRFRP